MRAGELIVSADKLLAAPASEADRRRAISTAYYALFNRLCEAASDALVGPSELGRARYQVFRSIEHGAAKDACEKVREPGNEFPTEVIAFADTFVALQAHRHSADYCPDCETTSQGENASEADKRSVAADLVRQAAAALAAFDLPAEKHRRAFALYVLLRRDARLRKPRRRSRS